MSDYNGWTNRETWLVNIWFMDSFDGERVTADSLEIHVDQHIDETVPPSSFAADMLNLGAINWQELADTHNADVAG